MGNKVLVVDDSALMRKVLRQVLSEGNEKANAIAEQTLDEVRQAMQMKY